MDEELDLALPLHRATAQGNAAEVARLLATGANGDGCNSQGVTPLHIAAGFGHSRVVRTLLAAGASPSLPGPGGLLPIHLAAVADQVAAARLLLEAAPHTAVAMDNGGETPAYHAAMNGCVAALRLLLQTAPQGALIKRQNVGELPLHAAASQGHDEAVRLLLQAAPEAALERSAPEDGGATPLFAACCNGRTSTARQLLAAAPQAASMLLSEPNQATPLYVAVCLGHLDIVRLVLEAAPHTAMLRCRAGRLALHAAAAGAQHPCSAAMVQLLLAAAPAAATVLADGGFAALHVAAAKANTGAARQLVEAAPAVLNMRAGPNHMTPLQVALVMAAAAEEAAHADWDEAEQFQPPSVYLETAQTMLACVPPAVSLPLLAAQGDLALPLFPELALHWPLTAAQWAQVPAPCPGLGRALPATLQRSVAEAALLVARLPPADASRLRTFALALHRSQRQLGVFLPAELAGRILSLFDA